MKVFKSGLALLTVLVLALAGCSSSSKNDKDIVAEADIPAGTEVVFWHAMNGAQEVQLKKIAADFMASHSNIKITLQNQSSYSDLQAKITATLSSPSNLPTITQAYPGWVYEASQENMLQEIDSYIASSKIGFTKEENYSDIVEGFRQAAVIDKVTYGVPFNKSTDVVFYNQDMLTKLNAQIPTTMEELKALAIRAKNELGVVGGGFDSLSNYFTTSLKNAGVDFSSKVDITDAKVKALVTYYNDGVKDGYFRIAGSDKYLSGPFGNQKILFNVGSSAGESFVISGAKASNFTAVAAPLPVDYNIQQGTDVYMFSNASAAQKSAAFLFMKYLVSADVQLNWAIATGYLPVRTSVLTSTEYTSQKTLIAPIAATIAKKYYTIPTSAQSNAVYTSTATFMEKVLSNPTQDIDAALKDYKTTFDSLWKE